MADYMEGITPAVLKWARVQSGYSLEEAIKSVTSRVDKLQEWEDGESYPTYRQLEKLANKYGRPLSLFFFPTPPNEPKPGGEFRTLPTSEISKLPPSVIKLIRQARVSQISLSELTGGANQAERVVFRELEIKSNMSPRYAAEQARVFLGISLEKQIGWKDNTTALKKWRESIQSVGIYVFKAPFMHDNTDGFCLYDSEFPVIYLNNSRPKNRQIFTLAHEFAHVLLRNNGMTQKNQDYISVLKGADKRIEVFCNRFAAEFLIPFDDVDGQMRIYRGQPVDWVIGFLSERYKTSREAVLWRLFNLGYITEDRLNEILNTLYGKEFTESTKGEGGNPYRNTITYLGDAFLGLAFGQYYTGALSLDQLADHLGMKPKNISRLEEYITA